MCPLDLDMPLAVVTGRFASWKDSTAATATATAAKATTTGSLKSQGGRREQRKLMMKDDSGLALPPLSKPLANSPSLKKGGGGRAVDVRSTLTTYF